MVNVRGCFRCEGRWLWDSNNGFSWGVLIRPPPPQPYDSDFLSVRWRHHISIFFCRHHFTRVHVSQQKSWSDDVTVVIAWETDVLFTHQLMSHADLLPGCREILLKLTTTRGFHNDVVYLAFLSGLEVTRLSCCRFSSPTASHPAVCHPPFQDPQNWWRRHHPLPDLQLQKIVEFYKGHTAQHR